MWRPRAECSGRLNADGHESDRSALQPSALHIEQLSTIGAPRGLIAPVRRNQMTLPWARIWLHVDLVSSGLIGYVRQPPAVRRKFGRHLVRGGLDDRAGFPIRNR